MPRKHSRTSKKQLDHQQLRIERVRNGQQFFPGFEEFIPDYLRPHIQKPKPEEPAPPKSVEPPLEDDKSKAS
jgi:hypothetical protein